MPQSVTFVTVTISSKRSRRNRTTKRPNSQRISESENAPQSCPTPSDATDAADAPHLSEAEQISRANQSTPCTNEGEEKGAEGGIAGGYKVVDFDTAAEVGQLCCSSGTLNFMAPETLEADQYRAHPSQDM